MGLCAAAPRPLPVLCVAALGGHPVRTAPPARYGETSPYDVQQCEPWHLVTCASGGPPPVTIDLDLDPRALDALQWHAIAHATPFTTVPRRDCAPPPHARRSTSSLRLRGSGPPDPPASGPARILSKNLNGIKSPGKLGRFLRAIKIEHRRNPLAAVLAQEHNLRPASRRALESAARAQRILVAAAFLPDDASSGARGGTLVAIPYDAIELAEGESIHDAVERVEASIKTSRDGRIVSVSTLFSGRKLRLVSAYAPSAPSALRPPFFRRALPRFLSKSAVLGIDANCVPDPTIDLRRDATSPYDNKGAAELADVVNDFELIDVAREQLGAEPFFSAHHTTPGGGMCHSRIDQIYAPSKDALLWSHASCHDFFPSGSTTLDHVAIQISLSVAEGKRGSDLRFIDERIFDDPSFNAALASEITNTYERNRHLGPGAAWALTKAAVRKQAMAKSREKRKARNDAALIGRLALDLLQDKVDKGEADAETFDSIEATKASAAREKKQARSLLESVEEHAFNLADRHDTGSAAFHRPFA